EAQACLEVQARLALDGEAEVAGLDDAGMDRSHRDLEQSLALDAAEGEGLPFVAEVGARRRVAPQRVVTLRPELMQREPARIRMGDGHEAEEIVDLALEPARRERARGER